MTFIYFQKNEYLICLAIINFFLFDRDIKNQQSPDHKMFLNLFYLATSIIVGVAIFIIVINFKSNRIVNVYFVIVTIIALDLISY